MEITVPSGEVQWLTAVVDAARVRSVEADSAADQAGLRRGDLIIAIDGTPVNGKVRSSTLAKSAREKSVRLTVLRDKVSMDIALGPLGAAKGEVRFTGGFSLTTHTLTPGDR